MVSGPASHRRFLRSRWPPGGPGRPTDRGTFRRPGVPETRVSLRSRCTLVGCARIADVSLTRVQPIKTLFKPFCETLLKLRLIKPYLAAKTLQKSRWDSFDRRLWDVRRSSPARPHRNTGPTSAGTGAVGLTWFALLPGRRCVPGS